MKNKNANNDMIIVKRTPETTPPTKLWSLGGTGPGGVGEGVGGGWGPGVGPKNNHDFKPYFSLNEKITIFNLTRLRFAKPNFT